MRSTLTALVLVALCRLTGAGDEHPRLVVQTGHPWGVDALAFSPDGRFVLSGGGEGTARLWEVDTGREIQRASVMRVASLRSRSRRTGAS